MKRSKKNKLEEEEELFRGNVYKKTKLIPINPLYEKVGLASIFVPNLGISRIYSILYEKPEENEVKTEVRSYFGETTGEAKCYFGEYCFEETMSTRVVLIYEKGKEKELEKMLREKFPDCTYIIKKSK